MTCAPGPGEGHVQCQQPGGGLELPGPSVDLTHEIGGPGGGADWSAAHWSRDHQPPWARAVSGGRVSGPQPPGLVLESCGLQGGGACRGAGHRRRLQGGGVHRVQQQAGDEHRDREPQAEGRHQAGARPAAVCYSSSPWPAAPAQG